MSEQMTIPDSPMRTSHEAVEFGTIDLRLTGRDWLIVAGIVIAVLAFMPAIAQRAEGFRANRDYRVPYELSGDYWLFTESARQAGTAGRTLVIGDSVIWGEYVAGDQTLPHYLNELVGKDAFANLGVDGMYPMAMEGLLKYYGGEIVNRSVVLHCNPLWMASPVHDLQAGDKFRFNHPVLIPQGHVFKGMESRNWRLFGAGPNIPYWAPRFDSQIRPYSAGLTDRLTNRVVRVLPYRSYVTHWRDSRLGSLDVPTWTMGHPYEDPFAIAPQSAPTAGPDPSHYEPTSWTQRRLPREKYPWVKPADSLQWHAFQSAVAMLLSRGQQGVRHRRAVQRAHAHRRQPGPLRRRSHAARRLARRQRRAAFRGPAAAQRVLCRCQPSAGRRLRTDGQAAFRVRGVPVVPFV